MEPVSFALALAGLPGVFTSCVDCYKRVRSCIEFEGDFDMALCKLQASELRLSRWGDSRDIQNPKTSLLEYGYRHEDILLAYHWLSEIKRAFDSAIETSDKCGSATDRNGSQILKKEVQCPTIKSTPSLHDRLRRFVYQQLRPRKRDRVSWALYRKEYFENLVENISSLTMNLVELFPLATEPPGLSSEGSTTTSDTVDLVTPFDVEDADKGGMMPTMGNGYLGRGKIYSQIDVRDGVIGHFGDNISDGKSFNRSTYSDINVRGRAFVHFGDNVS